MNCVTLGSLNSDDVVIDVMTKTIFQNWKVIAGLSMAAVLLGGAFSFGLFTPKAEAIVHIFDGSSPAGCLLDEVRHWDKIIFQILRDPSGTINPNYLKTPLDIKVLDDPEKVANLVAKVRNFLDDHGVGGLKPGSADIVSQLKIDIIDVEYAIVCVTTGLSNSGA